MNPADITQDMIRSLKTAKRWQEAHELIVMREEWLKEVRK